MDCFRVVWVDGEGSRKLLGIEENVSGKGWTYASLTSRAKSR